MTFRIIIWFALGNAMVIFAQMPPKPPIIPLTKDIPFIKCDVCQKAAKTIFKSVCQKRDEMKPVQIGEEDILTIIEKSCNPDDATYGEWITKLDILESKDTLKLREHTNVGKCREECKTVARACEESIGDVDTDIGEILWRNNLKLATFVNKVCHSLTDSCTKSVPKYMKGKRKDFKFLEMTEKDKQAIDMMKKMKGQPGMPGLEMYTPEDLESMKDQLGLDPEMAAKYKEKYAQQKAQQEATEERNTKEQQKPLKTQLGFFDTVKAMGSDIVKKAKNLFGFGKKSEL